MTWIIASIAVAIAAIWRAYVEGAKNAKNKMKADNYEQHLQDIDRANSARNSVTDSLPDKDKYRRD